MHVFKCGRCAKVLNPEESLFEEVYMDRTLCVSCRKIMRQTLTLNEKLGLFAEEELAENRVKYGRISNWYVWNNYQGMSVMGSHQFMDGVLVNWSEPPSPELLCGGEEPFSYYHAGEIEGCHCYPEPLIRPNTIQWPRRVYLNGTLVTMKQEQFEKSYYNP